MAPDTDGWSRTELHVMKELERLSAAVEANGVAIANLRVSVEHKSALWGAISGALVAAIGVVFRR